MSDSSTSSVVNDDQRESEGPFQAVRVRLEEIAQIVSDPELSLDEALDLYEEAVSLGLQASDLLEVDITAEEEQAAALEAATQDVAEGVVGGQAPSPESASVQADAPAAAGDGVEGA